MLPDFAHVVHACVGDLRRIEAFDDLLARDWIDGWKVVDGTTYIVARDGINTTLNPGQAMASANSYGLDVRFGKSS